MIGYLYGVGSSGNGVVPAIVCGLIGIFAIDLLRFVFKLIKIVTLTVLALVVLIGVLYVFARMTGP